MLRFLCLVSFFYGPVALPGALLGLAGLSASNIEVGILRPLRLGSDLHIVEVAQQLVNHQQIGFLDPILAANQILGTVLIFQSLPLQCARFIDK